MPADLYVRPLLTTFPQDSGFLSFPMCSVPIDFKAQQMPDKGNIFRQSNRSRAFIASGETTENQYIKQGNVMHALFAKIHSRQDIESAVKELVFEGIITQEEEKEYAQKIEQAIEQSDVKQWFDGNFRLFNECEILQKDENGKTQSRRPDRVMINKNEAIVVDYKFGEPKAHYTAQVQQYVDLLGKMGHRNVQGFLWYVSENRLERL